MGRQQRARQPLIIADAEGLHRRDDDAPKRSYNWNLQRLLAWWDDVELDLTWPWLICSELAWCCLLFAVMTQPFTRSLHWFWFAVLLLVQAAALQRVAVYIRESETPPIEVQPLHDLPDEYDLD